MKKRILSMLLALIMALGLIPVNAFAVEIAQTDQIQSMRIALAGSFGVPLHGLAAVLLHAYPRFIHPAYVEHRIQIALFG